MNDLSCERTAYGTKLGGLGRVARVSGLLDLFYIATWGSPRVITYNRISSLPIFNNSSSIQGVDKAGKQINSDRTSPPEDEVQKQSLGD